MYDHSREHDVQNKLCYKNRHYEKLAEKKEGNYTEGPRLTRILGLEKNRVMQNSR